MKITKERIKKLELEEEAGALAKNFIKKHPGIFQAFFKKAGRNEMDMAEFIINMAFRKLDLNMIGSKDLQAVAFAVHFYLRDINYPLEIDGRDDDVEDSELKNAVYEMYSKVS